MRSIPFSSLLLLVASLAFAEAPRVDLDIPGVLDQLKSQHPKQYQAVVAVLVASERAPCAGTEIKSLKARFGIKDVECGMILSTSYPALRHVSFEYDGVKYTATVAFKDDTTAQPANSTTQLKSSSSQ
jgi:hypothetical protein